MVRTLTLVILMTLGALVLPGAAAANAPVGAAMAELVSKSPDELAKMATHIVTGQVMAVYQRVETEGNYSYTKYVAEVRVKTCEKGDGIKDGALVYVRYWHRHWVGRGEVPPGASGHRGLPGDAENIRVYLVRNANDGLGASAADGGFNVVGPNGFEKVAAGAGAGGDKK